MLICTHACVKLKAAFLKSDSHNSFTHKFTMLKTLIDANRVCVLARQKEYNDLGQARKDALQVG